MKYYFILIIFVLGILGLVIAGAMMENSIALLIVGALNATFFICIGAGIVIVFQKLATDAEQKRFIQNERENLRILQESQKAQNYILNPKKQDNFLITDGVFAELD